MENIKSWLVFKLYYSGQICAEKQYLVKSQWRISSRNKKIIKTFVLKMVEHLLEMKKKISDLNDVIVHPEGSYTELEHLLMRLGLVTEIRPHASDEYDESALWETVGMEEEAQDKARRCVRHTFAGGGGWYTRGAIVQVSTSRVATDCNPISAQQLG